MPWDLWAVWAVLAVVFAVGNVLAVIAQLYWRPPYRWFAAVNALVAFGLIQQLAEAFLP